MKEAFGKPGPASSSGKPFGGRGKVGTKQALGRGLHPRKAPFLPWGTSAVLGVFGFFFEGGLNPSFVKLGWSL